MLVSNSEKRPYPQSTAAKLVFINHTKWLNPQKVLTLASCMMSFFVSQLGPRGTEKEKMPFARGVGKQFENAVVGNASSTDGYTNKKLLMQN